jgi:hypothetical protein
MPFVLSSASISSLPASSAARHARQRRGAGLLQVVTLGHVGIHESHVEAQHLGGETTLAGRRRLHQHGASVPRTNVACGFPALRSTERLPVNTGPQTDDELQDDGHGCSSDAGASVFPAGTCHATSVLLNRVRIPSLPLGGPPSHHQRRLSAPLVPHARRRGSRGSHRGSSLP